MLNELPAELLERVFLRLSLLDLLECAWVSRRLQRAVSRCTDWHTVRLRFGVRMGAGECRAGGAQFTGRPPDQLVQDPVQERRLDAMLQLRHSLRMERELNLKCAQLEPGAPPTLELDNTIDFWDPDSFNGAHRLVRITEDLYQLVDPRRRDRRPKRCFRFPVEEVEARRLGFLPGGRALITVRRHRGTGEVLLYHLDLFKEQPLARLVIGHADPYPLLELIRVECFTYEDRLCVVFYENAYYPPTVAVCQLPDLKLVLERRLPAPLSRCSQPKGHQSFFFLACARDSVQAFHIRTGQLFCQFREPSVFAMCMLSEDSRHLIAHTEGQLHVFDVPAEDSTPAENGQAPVCVPHVRQPLHMMASCYYRDRHILATEQGLFWVFDLTLRPLWQLHSAIPLTRICFVGECLFISSSGRVYDWRRRRRYLGKLKDYNVPLRLNRRRGAPCEHVEGEQVGPCLDCSLQHELNIILKLSLPSSNE